MRRLMPTVSVILSFSASLAVTGSVPECEAPGKLTIYEMMSQVGTVARCEHRNNSGDLTRRVYYSSRQPSTIGPFVDAELVVQEIREFRYNDENQLVRTDVYSGDHVFLEHSTRTYRANGTVVIDAFTSDGTRHSQTIKPENSRKTVMTFDDHGNTVVGIHGPLVEGTDLPHGWGQSVQGVSCSAASSGSDVRIDQITVYATLRNLSPHSLDAPIGHQYWVVALELRDSHGRTVPKNTQFIQNEMDRLRRINGRDSLGGAYRVLQPGEATYWGGKIELRYWYADVSPGRYQLVVTRQLDEPKHDIVCSAVPLVIGNHRNSKEYFLSERPEAIQQTDEAGQRKE